MTREEALKILEMFLHKQCDLARTEFAYDANTVWEAVNMASIALEQEPTTKKNLEVDCISRVDALDAIAIKCSAEELDIDFVDLLLLQRAIKGLPSVTLQEPKTGHWIIIDDCEKFIAKCSECGRIEDSRMICKYPYCHCGAKMESEG